MDNQLVSIIITAYNRANCIERAINSCLKQTYKNIEILIVDDASTDNAQEIVQSIYDTKVSYFRHSQNRGPAGARNTGLKNAHGQYIAFLDSDDEWLPEKIEKQVSIFKTLDQDIGLVFTNGYDEAQKKTFFPLGIKSGVAFNPKRDNFYPLRILISPPSSWLLPIKTVKETGYFDESMYNWDDGDYLARVAYKYPLYFLNENLVTWHASSTHVNVISQNLIKGKEIFLENNFSQLRKDKDYLFRFYRTIGKDASKIDRKKARQYFIKAFKLKPLNLTLLVKIIKTYV